jgi:serine/threonine protein kinase
MQNYKQLRLLGTGTYAKVYLSQKNGTKQFVAIKKVDAQRLLSTGLNIDNEIELLKKSTIRTLFNIWNHLKKEIKSALSWNTAKETTFAEEISTKIYS